MSAFVLTASTPPTLSQVVSCIGLPHDLVNFPQIANANRRKAGPSNTSLQVETIKQQYCEMVLHTETTRKIDFHPMERIENGPIRYCPFRKNRGGGVVYYLLSFYTLVVKWGELSIIQSTSAKRTPMVPFPLSNGDDRIFRQSLPVVSHIILSGSIFWWSKYDCLCFFDFISFCLWFCCFFKIVLRFSFCSFCILKRYENQIIKMKET